MSDDPMRDFLALRGLRPDAAQEQEVTSVAVIPEDYTVRVEALRLANSPDDDDELIVARAEKFRAFLMGDNGDRSIAETVALKLYLQKKYGQVAVERAFSEVNGEQ